MVDHHQYHTMKNLVNEWTCTSNDYIHCITMMAIRSTNNISWFLCWLCSPRCSAACRNKGRGPKTAVSLPPPASRVFHLDLATSNRPMGLGHPGFSFTWGMSSSGSHHHLELATSSWADDSQRCHYGLFLIIIARPPSVLVQAIVVDNGIPIVCNKPQGQKANNLQAPQDKGISDQHAAKFGSKFAGCRV